MGSMKILEISTVVYILVDDNGRKTRYIRNEKYGWMAERARGHLLPHTPRWQQLESAYAAYLHAQRVAEVTINGNV